MTTQIASISFRFRAAARRLQNRVLNQNQKGDLGHGRFRGGALIVFAILPNESKRAGRPGSIKMR